MREKEYKQFFAKFKPIIDDCVVNTKVAEQNPELYTIYEMKYRRNVGMKAAYNNEKVKKHIETLRELCAEVPQDKLRVHYIILPNALVSDELRAKPKDNSTIKKLRQQHNTAELFCSMLETTRYC